MGETGRAEQTTKFGIFEVDLRSGELRKSGSRIKLQEQPFKVLQALLERPGEVVTRDELRRRIWPDENFGDFDHAVNVAITKLRAALGDSAESPHLIETLHRRGYRFIFPVDDRLLPMKYQCGAGACGAGAWIPGGWSATLSATCKAAENDCLERRIRPCVPSHVAYKAERGGNELFWSPWKKCIHAARAAPKP